MEDIHVVIKGLKCCAGNACKDCPYLGSPDGCRQKMEADALEILQIAAAEK